MNKDNASLVIERPLGEQSEFKQGLMRLLLKEETFGRGYRRNFLKNKFDFVVALLDGKIIPPVEVEIQPTSKCNAACRHCFSKVTIRKKLKDRLLDKNMELVVKKILSIEMDGFKVKSVKFVGSCGDPLMNPKTLYAIELCKEAGRYTTIYTNGIGLSYSLNGKPYIERLVLADRIHVSLDAGTAKTFSYTKRVKGKHFERILQGIEKLNALRHWINPNLQVEVSYVITEDNYHEIKEACRKVKDCGTACILYRRNFIDTTEMTAERIEETERQLAEVKEYQDENFKVITQHSLDDITKSSNVLDFKSHNCYLPLIWGVVGSDGSIVPCGHRGGDSGWNFGNLIEQDFYQILSDPERSRKMGQLPDEDCKVCSPFMQSINGLFDYLFFYRDRIPNFRNELARIRQEIIKEDKKPKIYA